MSRWSDEQFPSERHAPHISLSSLQETIRPRPLIGLGMCRLAAVPKGTPIEKFFRATVTIFCK